jgi:cystathionine beta-lyase
MGKFDFDKIVDRHGTATYKYEELDEVFGRDDLTALWVADMDFEVCPAITEALSRRINDNHIYGYTVPMDSYWQSIIDWQRKRNNFVFTRDELTFVPGIVKGIALAVNFYTRPGDKIVIQQPVYHPFRNISVGNGRRVINNALLCSADGDYKMDLKDLERIFKEEHPRMMILCNPHNPIGLAWDAKTLKTLASLARKYDVIVVSDEIHGDLMLYGNKHLAFASVSDDAAAVAVTFGAPSKTFNIAGIVSSWIVVKNPELRRPFFNWLETNEFNSPTFFNTIATEAAYTYGGEWLDEALKYIEGNIDFVADYCKKYIPKINAIKPQASFLVWLDCTALGLDHDQLQDLFINKAHLALNDGEMFGHGGEGHMRFNVGAPRSVIASALDKLKAAVDSL